MLKNNRQPAGAQEPFVPLALLENALRNWWVITGLMIAGGLLGLLLQALLPPVYEATADFSVAVDLVATGPLTQYEEDLAINTAGNVFLSSDVIEQVLQQANDSGVNLQISDVGKKFSLERRISMWTLRVRHPDPAVALRLAEIWMAVGQASLRDGYQHALQAAALEGYLRAQENCLEKIGGAAPAGLCNSSSFAAIQQNLRDAGNALLQERQSSRGLFAGLLLGPFNAPQVGSAPVTAGRNQFVLLGALAGLLAGIALLELGLPGLVRTKRRA